MKNNLLNTFRKRIIMYTIISGAVTFLVEVLFMVNLKMIVEYLSSSGFRNWMIGRDGINPGFHLFLIILIGVAAFTLSFIFQIGDLIQYVKEISLVIQNISEGDLSTTAPVRGNDEFSNIASNLNKMTDEIKELIEKERLAEQSKNELITNVAHDLRTPLTSVLGYLELLQSNVKLEEETRLKYLGVAYQKAKRLDQLIEDLFGFTKLQTGKISMKPGRLDIIKLMEQLLDEFYPSFQEAGLEYEFQYSDPEIIIEADGNLLARLFDNLINNAVKYGADGKIIRVEITKEETMVSILVINYGQVIPTEELNNIFKKFYRVEQSRSADTGGTGLGLVIAKDIVELHGGTIGVTSSLKGTVFKVRLYLELDEDSGKFDV